MWSLNVLIYCEPNNSILVVIPDTMSTDIHYIGYIYVNRTHAAEKGLALFVSEDYIFDAAFVLNNP